MNTAGSDYEFGSGDDELARLELQGRALAPATRMIFDAAGIGAGMRVLDLGCGAGDVTFVAAGLVGLEGCVVGVDRSPESLARARLRAEQRGLAQVRFVQGDVCDPAPGGPRRPRIPRQRGGRHAGGDRPVGQQRPQTSPR